MVNYRDLGIHKITEAIMTLNPSAKITVQGDDIDTCKIEWFEGTPEISKADIKTEMDRLQAEYDTQDYARKRAIEYPSVQDFMEAYTEKEIGGDDTKWNEYKTKYNKVRSDNPKESS